MSYNQLILKFEDIEDLEKKFKLLPNTAEFEINNYMWSEASKILEKEVYKRMLDEFYNLQNPFIIPPQFFYSNGPLNPL